MPIDCPLSTLTHLLTHSLILTFLPHSKVMQQFPSSPAHPSQASTYTSRDPIPSRPIPLHHATLPNPSPSPNPIFHPSSPSLSRVVSSPRPITSREHVRPRLGMTGQDRTCHRVRPTYLPACLPTRRVRARAMCGPCGGLRGYRGWLVGVQEGSGGFGIGELSKGCGCVFFESELN
jgi:hypothetical protein